MPDQLLGNRYRILSKVGEGGMATVYQAEDMLLERIVALKVLRDQYASDPAFVERFKQEARAAAGLTHQNIVGVYDVGSDEGKNYIVMEYVEGTDLKQLISQGAPFTTVRAVSLILQILSGVAFAHSRGIVHRDLKPQNILVTSDGHAKVADFGIARAARSVQLTDTGTVLGSVHYCSPEQAQGKPVDQTSDVYSVGIIMYEMLTGQVPFEGEGALAVALKHLQEAPVDPSRLNARITPQLEAIVLKSLAKDPAQRYASAEDMRQVLLRYQQSSDQSTVTFAPVTTSFLGQDKTESSGREQYRPMPAGSKPSRHRGFDWVALILVFAIIAAIIGWIPLGQRVFQTYFSGVGTATPTANQGLVTVPNLVGMRNSDAERYLGDLGLKFNVVEEKFSDQFEMLLVMAQSIDPGSQVSKQSTIDVVVSKGSKQVIVPIVIDQTLAQASDTLTKAGLTVHYGEEANASVSVGVVFAQDPIAGRAVDRGAVVTLKVAKAPVATPTARANTPTPVVTPKSTITVPNLVGMEESAARELITRLGLENTYTTWQTIDDVADKAFFNSIPVGCVLSHQPAAGTEAKPGTTINIAVRKQ